MLGSPLLCKRPHLTCESQVQNFVILIGHVHRTLYLDLDTVVCRDIMHMVKFLGAPFFVTTLNLFFVGCSRGTFVLALGFFLCVVECFGSVIV